MYGFMAAAMAFWMGLFMLALFAIIIAVQNELLGRLFLFAQLENDDRPSKDALDLQKQQGN